MLSAEAMDTVDHVPGGDDGEVDQNFIAAVLGYDQMLVGAERLELAQESRDYAPVGVPNPSGQFADQETLV